MRSQSLAQDHPNILYVLDVTIPAGNKQYLVKLPGPVMVLDAKFVGKTSAAKAITIGVLNDKNASDLPNIQALVPYTLTEKAITGTPVALMTITTPSNAYGAANAVPVVGADTAVNRMMGDEQYSVLSIATETGATYTAGNHLFVYYTDYK